MIPDDVAACDLSRVVEAAAERDPEHVAVVFERGVHPPLSRTFGELAVQSGRLAGVLAQAGLGRGDAVGVMMRNDPAFVETVLALSRLGAVFVPIDPRARGAKLRHLLSLSRCAAVVVSDVVEGEARTDLIAAGVAVWVARTEDGGNDGGRSLDEAVAAYTGPLPGFAIDDPSKPWSIAFTSGTTGDPKGLVLRLSRMLGYRGIVKNFDYRQSDVTYTGLSLTHGNAQVVTLFPALWGEVDHAVLSPWFTTSRLWEICGRFGATTWSNLGGLAAGVLNRQPTRWDKNHRVRQVVSAGMPADIWTTFEKRFGVRVLEWYGTMEGGFAVNPIRVGPLGSMGQPPANLYEMEVHDDRGVALPPGEDGELVVRPTGQEAVVEYIGDPDASGKKVRDGWMRTGDIVRRDVDGWLYYQRRRDDTGLRRLGEFISSGFVSRTIAELDDVDDVAVYGRPAKSGAPGEIELVAAITPVGASVDLARLWAHCLKALEPSHVPDYVQVLSELPATASGKVLTRALAQLLTDPQTTHARPERRS